MTHCILIGAPVDEGQRRPGCLMGPAAYRVAGLARTLSDLGHTVEDRGDVAPTTPRDATAPACVGAAVAGGKYLATTVGNGANARSGYKSSFARLAYFS